MAAYSWARSKELVSRELGIRTRLGHTGCRIGIQGSARDIHHICNINRWGQDKPHFTIVTRVLYRYTWAIIATSCTFRAFCFVSPRVYGEYAGARGNLVVFVSPYWSIGQLCAVGYAHN